MGSGAPSHSLGNITIHGVIRRRDSDDSLGEKRSRTSLEPPTKRARRTESEPTTVMAPSTSTSQAATPEVSARDPSGSITSVPSVTHGIQRPSGDTTLEPDNTATPPPSSDNGVADENVIHDDGAQSSEQNPPAETTSEPQAEIPTLDFHENRVVGETGTPVPSVRDPSSASPEMKQNPFTKSRIFLLPPDMFPSLVRSAVVPDLGRLSLHSPAVRDGPSQGSTTLALLRESTTQKTYVFSAAEIRTLVASRGSDEGSGPNKLVFYLDWGLMGGISKWRNFKAGQG